MAGAAVMIVELGVARILTPVFGGSISVWAIVIATTMLALAAGYAFGGYRADRTGGIIVARRAATIGALLCAVIPLLRLPLIENTISLPTLTGASVAALILIAPALFFLSQVSPALIRGLSDEGVSHVGITAGGIYAISTLGSLAGTLGAVWAFLYWPLMTGFLVTAFLVVISAMLLHPVRGSIAMTAGAVLVGLFIYAGMVPHDGEGIRQSDYRLVEKRSSLYGEIRVIEQDTRYRYMIVNGFDQGGIDLRTGQSAYTYDDGLLGLGQLYADNPSSVLIIGLGPGVIANRLLAAGLQVDTVEIDAEIFRVARDYFDFAGDIIVDDGRRYLQKSDQHWDMIIVDAFAGGSPPWQLYTREAFTLYSSHLRPGGVVVLNFIGSHLEPGQRKALEAVVGTARAVFPTVEVYPDPWETGDYPTRNIFIAASGGPRRTVRQPGDPMQAGTLSHAIARSEPVSVAAGRILTDESAPLEPMVRRTTQILRNRVREYLPVALLIR